MKTSILSLLLCTLLYGCGGSSDTPVVPTPEPEPEPPVVEPPTEPEPEPEPPVVEPPPEPEPEPEYPEAGTTIGEPYCLQDSFDKAQDYVDGEGGTYTETVEQNSLDCGYIEPPTICPSDPTDGNELFGFMNCDGQWQRTGTDFHTNDSEMMVSIDILVMVDRELDTKGMTVEQFVQKEFDFANQVFANSNVHITLNVAGIEMVDVADNDDLRDHISDITNGRAAFADVDRFQNQYKADLVYGFIKRPEDPIACGVANLDASRGRKNTRGVVQCFQGDVFQPDYLRYYNRAYETFVHEVGHSLGLEHDIENASNFGSVFDYSYGYVIPGTKQLRDGVQFNGVGTIMSYSDEPIGLFSDPDVKVEIDGKMYDRGDDGNAFSVTPPPRTDAVESLNRTRIVMSRLFEDQQSNNFFTESDEDKSLICFY